MSRSWPVYSLRVPEELHAKISKAARRNKRSINSEYLHRLDESLDKDGAIDKILEEIKLLNEKVDRILRDKKPD